MNHGNRKRGDRVRVSCLMTAFRIERNHTHTRIFAFSSGGSLASIARRISSE
jgi:hypothetical protein